MGPSDYVFTWSSKVARSRVSTISYFSSIVFVIFLKNLTKHKIEKRCCRVAFIKSLLILDIAIAQQNVKHLTRQTASKTDSNN